LVGLTYLAQLLANGQATDLTTLFESFLPPHSTTPGRDPFALIEGTLVRIMENRDKLSLVAVPTFIWFSTRLFASVRTALNHIFDVAIRPPRRRHFVLSYLFGKLRDVLMVILTLGIFLANTALSAAVGFARARGEAQFPRLGFLFGSVGRWLPEVFGFLLALSLFFFVYKYASVRRLPAQAALVASAFAALAFELAKRLFGVYLANVAEVQGFSLDLNIGAAILTVLWVYYTALVFLLGGVVAETWQLGTMQRRQRAILT
jgi:membrane protein